MQKPIIVEVQGGVVQEVYNIPYGVKVEVRDFDIQNEMDPNEPEYYSKPYEGGTYNSEWDTDKLMCKTPYELLKEIEYMLNCLPNTRYYGLSFKSTYDLASEVGKHLQLLKTNEE